MMRSRNTVGAALALLGLAQAAQAGLGVKVIAAGEERGWTCSAADPTVTCTNPGPVDPGASSTITLTVNVGSAAYPGVTNLATVTNASDRNISNNAMGDPTDLTQR